ncbi:MAG: hypothetical protein NTW50_02245, partial [Candidatus Berkelbacteria bacterium]|nr:hypothetical protein [Candidatus Berkelbacteria bacterium]
DVFASDNSERAVKDSQENVDWLSQNTGFRSQNSVINIFQADATSIDFKKLLLSANCQQSTIVVTEPYLGEPKKFKPSLKAAQGEYVKIKELYLNFFRNLQLAHLPTCSLAIVFPLIETADGKRFSLYRECVDEIKKIGYTIPQSPLIYGRDYQVVKREIALLTIAEY